MFTLWTLGYYGLFLLQTDRGDISQFIKPLGEFSTLFLEAVGVTIIFIIALYALGYAIYKLLKSAEKNEIFHETRNLLIRGILLGLDFLVAADIIRTVVVELSFTSVGVLAIIVVIRIVLSFALEVEVTGLWPWQKKPEP